MNDSERAEWVDNDETLYLWWKQIKGSKAQFIKENRAELDEYIERKLHGK